MHSTKGIWRLFLPAIIIFFSSCSKENPNAFRLNPPGSTYITEYQSMQLVGSFQNWQLEDTNSYMSLVDDYQWEKEQEINSAGEIQFKFVPDHSWDPAFGTTGSDTGLSGYVESVSGVGTDITAEIPESGTWLFTFNEESLYYSISNMEGYSGALEGIVAFSDDTIPPYPSARVKLFTSDFEEITSTTSDTANGYFGFYSVPPNSYYLIISSTGYLPESLSVEIGQDTVNIGEVELIASEVRTPPEIDGINDFLPEDIAGIDPTGDMTETNLDLDTLWAVMLESGLYIGWNAYASEWGCTYGIYITDDTTSGVSATTDPWGRRVTASFGYPPFAVYMWHTEEDTMQEAQLCTWQTDSWDYPLLRSVGGEQGYNSEQDFAELFIPTEALGNPSAVFIELFTAGGENTHAQDTSPADPNVDFTSPDWDGTSTVLSAFVEVTE